MTEKNTKNIQSTTEDTEQSLERQCNLSWDDCNVPIQTNWNKTQPNLVMRGFAESVEIKNGICYIN